MKPLRQRSILRFLISKASQIGVCLMLVALISHDASILVAQDRPERSDDQQRERGRRGRGGDGERRSDGDGGRQRGPRGGGFTGRGGPGGFSPGMLGTLMREDAKADLNLSEEDQKKLQELAEKMRPQREEMQPYFEKMRDAKTDEERNKAREEMTAMFQKRAAEADKEVRKVIGEEKAARVQQLNVQYSGGYALLSPEMTKDLNLSDAQKEQIEKMMEERGAALRELGFRASREDRQKFDQEWNAKMFSVLTPEQREIWSGKAGKIIVDTGVPGASNANFSANGSRFASPKKIITTDIGSEMIRPDGAGTETISSFGAVAQNSAAPKSITAPANVTTENTSESSETDGAASSAKSQADTIGFGELPQASTQLVSFNFRFAPWTDVLKQFAQLAGLTLDLNDVPPGTFNYYDTGEYTPVEALDVLNGYLLQKGYLLVRRNQFLVVLNIDSGIPPNLIPNVPLDELPNRGKNEIMRVRIPLKGIEADVAAKEVEALTGPQGQIVPLRTSNSLLITDIGDNLQAITQLLESVTTEEDPNEIILQTFKINSIDAVDAEQMVRDQFGLPRGVTNVSAFNGDGRSSSSTRSSSNSSMNVTADSRTNSLIVTAPRSSMKLVEELIKAIDVGDGDFVPGQRNTKPFLRVYTVQNSDAREITKSLSSLYPGVVVNEDGRSRRIHIMATEDEHDAIGKMIEEMDGAGGDTSVSVFYLNRLDAIGAANTLDALFISDGEGAPIIQPDTFGRRLLIRGSHEQVTQIKTVMGQLGESGEQGEQNSGRGKLRVTSLNGRDASEFLNLMQRSWSMQAPNPIRIVVPSARNPVQGEFVPSKLEDTTEQRSRPAAGGETSRNSSNEMRRTAPQSYQESLARELERVLDLANTNPVDDALEQLDAEAAARESQNSRDALLDELEERLGPAEPAPAPALPEKKSDAPISLTLDGDNLIMASEDEMALDQLEDLIQSIGMALPPQTSWTLFYLQTADATEVAYMLEQLIPDSSVSSSSSSSDGSILGSLMGVGEQMADATGLSSMASSSSMNMLRIIPDIRLNALFVSGPSNLVTEVEQFLKVLDASDLPESLRDRVPRAIPVEYADVNDIHKMISDIYKDYLSTGNSGNNGKGGNNPLAAMLMGGGSGTKNGRPELAKLALAVDERTSQLIVSAGDALFREIEAQVKQSDADAKAANPTVRVVHLDSADPIMVQQTLTSLLPKVKVSVTGASERRTNNDQNSGRDNNNDDNNEQQKRQAEAVRKMMEQRMQQQMQGRQGGGGGGGDAPRSRGFQFGGRRSRR